MVEEENAPKSKLQGPEHAITADSVIEAFLAHLDLMEVGGVHFPIHHTHESASFTSYSALLSVDSLFTTQYKDALVGFGVKSVGWISDLSPADYTALGIKPLHVRKIQQFARSLGVEFDK